MNDLIKLLRGRRIDGRSADEIMRLAADEIESLQSQLSYRIEERDDSNRNLTAALRREVAYKDRLAEAEALLLRAARALRTGAPVPQPTPQPEAVTEFTEGAVSVVNPQGTEETGTDRPAAPDSPERPEFTRAEKSAAWEWLRALALREESRHGLVALAEWKAYFNALAEIANDPGTDARRLKFMAVDALTHGERNATPDQ